MTHESASLPVQKSGGFSWKSGAAAVMVSLSCLGIFRAVAATTTIQVLAKLVRAIEITVNTSLNFGTIAITNTTNPATASMDPASSRLTVDSSGGLSFAGGTPTAGRLTIKGAPFPVNVTVAAATMQINNGGDSLEVRDFKFGSAHGGPHATVTPAGPGNSVAINLGATIISRPGQTEGVYSGANTIFANYQ